MIRKSVVSWLVILVLLSINLLGCNDSKTSNDKRDIQCSLQVDSISNNSKIKDLGKPSNLEILNGIKGFQFGMNISALHQCVSVTQENGGFIEARYQKGFAFQGIIWPTVELYFIDNELVGIELTGKVHLTDNNFKAKDNGGNPYFVQKNFSNLLGLPNSKPLSIEKKEVIKTVLQMTEDWRNEKPKRENLQELIIEMNNINNSGWKTTYLRNTNVSNTFVNVPLEYYSFITLSCAWKSQRYLTIEYTRDRSLDLSSNVIKNVGNTVKNINTDYYFEDIWTITISSFVNIETSGIIAKYKNDIMLLEELKKKHKDSEDNKKELIKGF